METKSIRGNRDSSIELLRIIAMFCIVAHHYVVNSDIITITRENILTFPALFSLLYGGGVKQGLTVLY